MKQNLHLPILTACLLLLALAARADLITLANGRLIEGRVLSKDDTRVEIEAGGVITRLSMESVLSIEQAPEYENTLLAAETSLRRRDPVRGIDQLFAALSQGAPRDSVKQKIEDFNVGIAGGIANAEESKRPAIRRSLRALMDQDLLTTNSLFLTSQNFHQLEDWDSAAEALNRIPPDVLAADPMQRRWALDFMRLLIKKLLARSDFEGALGYVERMRRITGDESDPQLPIAHLTRAAAARDRHDFTLAFTIIANDLGPVVPEIARNRAVYTIEQLQLWATAKQNFQEAREALSPIRRFFPLEVRDAENRLLAVEAQAKLDNGNTLDALVLVNAIPPDQRTPDLDHIYRTAYHLVTLEKIGEADPLALLKHGRWCLENGLYTDAIDIFNRTRDNPNLRDLSNELLVNTRRERDTKLLEEAQAYMKYGNIQETINRTQIILANAEVGSRLSDEARRLEELARKSMGREAEARPYQAEVFFQQAERAYFLQKFEESLNLINMVLDQYPDTPAARRAATLLPDVIRSLEISYLEGKIPTLPKLPPGLPLERIQRTDRLGEEVNRLLDTIPATRR